ncbi:deoxyribodipyrimidine photo-lyase [Hyphococcus flavus]|uniref:Deoxyribodipyrimidine photo-lyase n=1 Tax=Hyphococcus flavus TaxID=1866326 RepID=A0AAE9ZAY4_9PROT|nr:deoxyribodipyrimidine photo-lyase [Hyphococcus flavus]WDI31028.1 deoxyribodipyrimidine photo-lyase [Hyphococcus flavus]
MTDRPVIVWFRNDLRIEDNPALFAARETGAPVIPLYILDDNIPHAPGSASLWWLHHSLSSLAETLEGRGAKLILRCGDSQDTLKLLADETNASHVFWNRRYYAKHIEIDKALKSDLKEQGITVETFNGSLLREPWEVETGSGGPYRVFTPFWKALKRLGPARIDTAPNLRKISGPSKSPKSEKLSSWNLLPKKPNWAKEFVTAWKPGEQGARDRLNHFLNDVIDDYASGRDRPDKDFTSRLSPHLAFGEISPLQIWKSTHEKMAEGKVSDNAAMKFLSEVAWREFSYNLLFYNEALPNEPLRENFKNYPWRDDPDGLNAWQKGMTGYPIVDAGMRQLWRTGWMHNRVRMIVASFLIKDLLIPWQEGEAWFWDTLVDADLSNNSASWQWVAGCGADAAPYFRIFNPITQGEKFDPDGEYVREFVPELKKLPKKHIHAPWKAPEGVLHDADIKLGKTYPFPIIDHAKARERALEGYNEIKGA